VRPGDSSGVVFCILIVAGRPLIALGKKLENGISACVSNIFIRLPRVIFRSIVLPFDISPVLSVDLLMVQDFFHVVEGFLWLVTVAWRWNGIAGVAVIKLREFTELIRGDSRQVEAWKTARPAVLL
jgi:hypothetical protein